MLSQVFKATELNVMLDWERCAKKVHVTLGLHD